MFCTKLSNPFRLDVPDQSFLKGVEPFHQFMELFRCQLLYLLGSPRPLVAESGHQPLVKEAVSVAFKNKAFDPVAAPAAEQEKGSFFKGVEMELLLYEQCQRIYTKPHIGEAYLSPHKDNVGYPHRIIILIFSKTVYFARLSKEKMRITY